MNDLNAASRMQMGIDALFDIAGDEIQHSSETDTSFTLSLAIEVAKLGRTLGRVSPYTNLFDIGLECHVQRGSGRATLAPTGLLTVDWSEDVALSPPDLDTPAIALYENVVSKFSRPGHRIEIEALQDGLLRLSHAGATVDLTISIFLDKTRLVSKLGLPTYVSALFYVRDSKLLEVLCNSSIPDVCSLFLPGSESAVLALVANLCGAAEGPNIRIVGRDRWRIASSLEFHQGKWLGREIEEANNFRGAECHWEIPATRLTPYHLLIERSDLSDGMLLEYISRLRDRLAIAHLSNHLQTNNATLECDFRGFKRATLSIPSLKETPASNALYDLFSWAYENSSSDKLGIVRQIISLQLGPNADLNFSVLRDKAGEISGIAKSNFQVFLQRSVELYFDKRLKVSEFLNGYSQEVSDSVSRLGSELIDNLYKTIGVILGVVLAALIEPRQAPIILWLASLLYFGYILFILIYTFISAYLRFRDRTVDYEWNVAQLSDVLSGEEISRLQGTSFARARRTFLLSFALSNVVYACLGAIAFLLLQYFWQMI